MGTGNLYCTCGTILVVYTSKKMCNLSIFKFLRGLMTKGMRKSSIYFMWKIVTSTGKMHLQREETIDFQQLSHGLIGCFSTRSGELRVWKGLFVYWEDFRAQASSTSFISTSFQLFQVSRGLLSPPWYQYICLSSGRRSEVDVRTPVKWTRPQSLNQPPPFFFGAQW